MKQHSLETFLDACGAREPLCLDVAAPQAGDPRRQVLHQPFALVGRHDHADVCLSDNGVSRRHALVQVIAGRTHCLDLGSRTGTHWDGAHGNGWLPGAAPFRVGPYQLSIIRTGPDSIALPPDGWDPLARGSLGRYALPLITLHILNHGTTVFRWPMNRVLAVVGSAQPCKVRLRGPGVSKYHCALVCTPVGVWAIDLQRRGGVEVNDTRVGHALLEDGDRLQLGTFTLCVEYQTPVAQSEVPAPALAVGSTSTSLVAGVLGAAGALRTLTEAGPLAAAAVHAGPLTTEALTGLMQQFSAMQQQLFEQSLTMMFQMFRTMHTEQVGILRQEMARLEELNREMQALLAERAKIAPPPAPAQAALTPPAAAPPAAAPTPVADKPPADKPAADKPPADKPAAPPRPIPNADPDLHIWLCQRMEAIQTERQSLWDRIVGAIGKRD